MKRIALFSCCLLALLCWNLSPAQAWEALVIKVVDGDSLLVRYGGTQMELRLYGIDAPEYRQQGGRAAHKVVKSLLHGKRVQVEAVSNDRYGRIVALVYQNGVLINRELVRRGQAWVYPNYCRRQPLCREWQETQHVAQAAGIGLWQSNAAEPPWKFRARQGKKQKDRRDKTR